MDSVNQAATSRPAAGRHAERTASLLAGGRLDPITALLLTAGAAASLLFTAVYLVEGATRPGYDAWVQPISALSLGPGGRLQQLNFVAFGLVTILCSALGWRRTLRPGLGATVYPILRVIEGLTLIIVGLFSQDPARGYPPGAIAMAPTLHGEIHTIVSYVAFTSLLATLVLARRFAAEPRWRGWVWPTALFGILPIAFIAAFGATYGHAPSGVFERLASSAGLPFSIALLARLLLQGRRTGQGW